MGRQRRFLPAPTASMLEEGDLVTFELRVAGAPTRSGKATFIGGAPFVESLSDGTRTFGYAYYPVPLVRLLAIARAGQVIAEVVTDARTRQAETAAANAERRWKALRGEPACRR